MSLVDDNRMYLQVIVLLKMMNVVDAVVRDHLEHAEWKRERRVVAYWPGSRKTKETQQGKR